jgi:hypothetical protein
VSSSPPPPAGSGGMRRWRAKGWPGRGSLLEAGRLPRLDRGLPKPSRFELTSVADLDELVTCLPILQQVLQGFREEHAFRIAREAMFALPVMKERAIFR